MFLVHNSFILMFPVAYFLSQNTERLEMAFANNSMTVESQGSSILYSLNMGTFYGKRRPK